MTDLKLEGKFHLCACLLWHGSVCMCKSSFTVGEVKKKKMSLRSVAFQVSLRVLLCQLVPLGSVDAVGTPGEPHDDGDDGGLEEEHHPVGGSDGGSG